MSNVRTDSRDYDVIAVGSGHHGLIAAAYLAKVGKRVLVLERQDYIGGGCVTKELAPGFRYDEHSTVHQVILSNPLLKADELGLKALLVNPLMEQGLFSPALPLGTLISRLSQSAE